MKYIHTGLVCGSEETADRFYRDLLGLEKLNVKILPAELSNSLFKRPFDLTVINYANDGIHFEIFISDTEDIVNNPVGHTCLAVVDRDGLVRNCKSAGAEVIEVPKGESTVVFVKDFDGNLFEVKQS